MTTKPTKPKRGTLAKITEKDCVASILRHYQLTQKAHRQAVVHAILTGVLLSHAKETLVHGNFKAWITETLPGVSYDTANRYRKLAAALRAHFEKLRCATFEGKELHSIATLTGDKQEQFLKQVEEFVGERTLTELYFDFEVCNRPDPRGGKRISKPGKLTEEEELQAIQAEWSSIVDSLYEGHEQKSWALLPKGERVALLGTLEPLVKDLRKSVS